MHLARQPALDREVALKELHSAHVKDAAFAHRFLNESRVAGALNHPSVVSVIEYFEHEGVPFIAMEYLERGSLRPLVGQLTLAQVAGVLDSVLGGLAEAAAQGIVHRDLKPENVLVTADGHAKVADFGIAKAIGQVCMTDFRTATGQIVGTPAYMAPEQISGGEITPQVDLYATGLLAYELLAGRHPFHGTDAPMALLMRHVNDDPPPLASVRPDLPPGSSRGSTRCSPRTRPPGPPARRRPGTGWRASCPTPSGRAGGGRRRSRSRPPTPRRGGRARAAERAVRDLPGRPAAPAGAGAERAGADRPRRSSAAAGARRPVLRARALRAPRRPRRRRRPRRARPPARSGRRAAPRDRGDPVLDGARRGAARGPARRRPPARRQRLREAVTPALVGRSCRRELSSLVPGASPDARPRPRSARPSGAAPRCATLRCDAPPGAPPARPRRPRAQHAGPTTSRSCATCCGCGSRTAARPPRPGLRRGSCRGSS